jgi:predicted ester cyclase
VQKALAQNKASVRAYFERFADMAVVDEIFGASVRFHYPLGDLNGLEAVKTYLVAVRNAFPDIHFKIEDILGEAELVATRWTLQGTQTGQLRGKQPTGKLVNVPGNTIFRLREGRIVEMWVAFDPARLF